MKTHNTLSELLEAYDDWYRDNLFLKTEVNTRKEFLKTNQLKGHNENN